ncbi:MAG: phosphoribosylaminoimidazolesuccinocarboxamide synthase [Gemmatimonadales bacterium]|nr:phosphoribosylaminoimidazolesuccinocarboxamide synthase [Gemmatimonadales bacterium]
MSVQTAARFPLPLVRRGKVREVYDAGSERVLLVTSDRISAFDVVMAEAIPYKGEVLTQLSAFWFETLRDTVPSHYITADTDAIVDRLPALEPYRHQLAGRSMLARRTTPIPFECVVRGYLAGSAWAEYRESGTLAGQPLPEYLVESHALDPPLFSPATKAETGHDENITFATMVEALGTDRAQALRDASLALYQAGQRRAADRGIIIADTKFEFGVDEEGRMLLIDELLTPDSSRFWPASDYRPGLRQPSFDKQPLRDYLADLKRAEKWDGEAPPPRLPPEVVEATSARYLDAFERLTGRPLGGEPA